MLQNRQEILIIGGILALLVYLGMAWFILTPQAVWSPDEGAKLLQLQNLRLENRHLAQDIAYAGRELDPDLQFVRADLSRGLLEVQDGALYFQRLPLFTLLTAPLFRQFGFEGLYLLPAIGGVLCGTLALQLLERSDRRLGMWVLIAFGSPIFIYSMIFWEHTLAISLGLFSAWLALRIGLANHMASFRKALAWVAIGAALGASVYIRLEMVIFALALVIACWFIHRSDRWGPVWAGVSLGLVLLPYMPLHQSMFGQPTPNNARYLFYPFRYLMSAQWRAVPDVLIGPFRDEAIDPGWLGAVWVIAAIIAIVCSFGPTTPLVRSLRLTGLGITVLAGATFLFSSTYYRSAHGLLFTTPWALLGICRARDVWQRGDRRARTIVLTTVLGLAGYTVGMVGLRAGSPHGGLEWGNRFAMTFYPFLALMAAWDWGAKGRDPKTLAIVGALVFLGLGFQARGVWTIRHDKQVNGALNRTLTEMPPPYVVSDLWWMPFNAAPIYTEKAIFVAPTPKRLGNWVEQVAAHHVRQFCLVTLNRSLVKDVAPLLDQQQLDAMEIQEVENLVIYRLAIEPKSN